MQDLQDGTAILWGEGRPTCDRRPSGGLGVSAAAAAAEKGITATGDGDGCDGTRDSGGGQLFPQAIMRGHDGSNVWRLAVHTLDHGRDVEGGRVSRGACADVSGLTLVATGGNDGAVKLWDLAFEAACQTRRR